MTKLDTNKTLRDLLRQNDKLKKAHAAKDRRDRIYQRQLRVLLSALNMLGLPKHWADGKWAGPGDDPAKIARDAIDAAGKVDMT